MMPSNNNHNTNESFKLLELSDDLKSLSDLELPEIINQKKRKVRRKTRSRTPSSRAHSSHNPNEPPLPCHKNMGIWIAVFTLGGWLFLLSYMTTVIHTENNRLKLEVEKFYEPCLRQRLVNLDDRSVDIVKH